jgi:hypothetical protein
MLIIEFFPCWPCERQRLFSRPLLEAAENAARHTRNQRILMGRGWTQINTDNFQRKNISTWKMAT